MSFVRKHQNHFVSTHDPDEAISDSIPKVIFEEILPGELPENYFDFVYFEGFDYGAKKDAD